MIQVDFFWSYGLGAGFALAAGRQLIKEGRRSGSAFQNMFFTHTLLFMSLFFVPSGVCLLWAFTNWETMQVFYYKTLPAWLVTAFVITNITQGILGFWVVFKLLMKKKKYLAFLQAALAYFIMFFILVHGWDGTGYQRFFSFNRAAFLNWGAHPGLENAAVWATSPVALALYGMGIIMLPWLMALIIKWVKEGYKLGDVDWNRARKITAVHICLYVLLLIFVPLGCAVGASLLIHWLGWLPGLAVFAVLAYAIMVRRGGLVHMLAVSFMAPKGGKL